jgi:hypothetical protein
MMLGTVGGQLVRPVPVDRASNGPWETMLQSRAERSGSPAAYVPQTEGPMTYNGGYSYAPEMTDALAIKWAAPDYYHYPDVPLPTVAELDARQAALLADPELQFRSRAADDLAQDYASAVAQAAPKPDAAPAPSTSEQLALAPEPRTDSGALPAIW